MFCYDRSVGKDFQRRQQRHSYKEEQLRVKRGFTNHKLKCEVLARNRVCGCLPRNPKNSVCSVSQMRRTTLWLHTVLVRCCVCGGLLQSYKPVLFDIEACVNRNTIRHYLADFFAWPCRVVSRSCLRVFSRIFAADFPTLLNLRQKNTTQLSAHKFACTAGQNPRAKTYINPLKPCTETLHPFRLLAVERPYMALSSPSGALGYHAYTHFLLT